MERIKDAVSLAKDLRKHDRPERGRSQRGVDLARPRSQNLSFGGNGHWSVPSVELDPEHLERHRIVSCEARDPSHVAFNVLRTRLYQALGTNAWKSVAITSPTSGCGKTMVAINLAFSLARQKGCKTVLIDLDLRKSSVAKSLGVEARRSIGQFLEGNAQLEECFVQVTDNLLFGLSVDKANNVFELAQHHSIADIVPQVVAGLDPAVVVIDLPPILSNDDAITFLPFVDAAFLVAAAGQTTAKEIEECEAEFNGDAAFLGVVLNKCVEDKEEYYQ